LLLINEFENVEGKNSPVREKAVYCIVLVHEDVEIRVQSKLQSQAHPCAADIQELKRSTRFAKSCIAKNQGAEPIVVQVLCFSEI